MSKLIRVSLSSAQLEWLKSHNVFPEELLRNVEITASRDSMKFFLPVGVADSISDALTAALAEVGFERNNDLTMKGKVLEELIDQFNGLGDAGD